MLPSGLVNIAANINFNSRRTPGLITRTVYTRKIATSHWPKCLWLALVELYNKEKVKANKDIIEELLNNYSTTDYKYDENVD